MPPPSEQPDLPPELSRRLKNLYRPPIDIPRHLDDAILADARRRASHLARFRAVTRWIAAGAAAAAILLLCLRLIAPGLWHPPQRLTMLDAYRLALQLQAGEKPSPKLDLNHDGTVDQLDVDAIAKAAVKLGDSR